MKSGNNNPKLWLELYLASQTLHGWDELQRCSIDFDLRQIEDTEMEFW